MSRKRKPKKATYLETIHTVQTTSDAPRIDVLTKVKPKTKNQRQFLRSLYNNDITFCTGPAGTGKTHLSVGVAVDLLQRNKVQKILVARAVIEAGQKRNGNKSALGYLPGDIDSKMAPFIRPLYDELGKFLRQQSIRSLKEHSMLEICPLEFMRGRTFENTFVICDEAQNASEEQIEMLLTRLGNGSKMVIVGDTEQSDLPSTLEGGLENFIDDLDGIEGIGIIELETCDVARHPLVAAIIERRKQVKQMLASPATMERVIYEQECCRNQSKDSST